MLYGYIYREKVGHSHCLWLQLGKNEFGLGGSDCAKFE